MNKFLAIIVLFVFSTVIYAEEIAPKHVFVIASSCSQEFLYLTVIDTDANEIVILTYGNGFKKTELWKVLRTGMIVNPKDYAMAKGGDAPFKGKD